MQVGGEAGRVGKGGRLGNTIPRFWRWLGSRPFKRTALNWVLWGFVTLIVISVAAASGSGHSPAKPATASPANRVMATSTSTDGATTTRVSSTIRQSATARPSTTSSVPSTGAEVVNTAGAVLANPSRTPGAINPQVTQADGDSTI